MRDRAAVLLELRDVSLPVVHPGSEVSLDCSTQVRNSVQGHCQATHAGPEISRERPEAGRPSCGLMFNQEQRDAWEATALHNW